MSLNVIILAAGKGTRMQSNLPKVLHQVGGQSMLKHSIDIANKLEADNIIVVYGHGGEQVKTTIDDKKVSWVQQVEQLGTGHAVQQTIPELTKTQADLSLVLYADVPLVQVSTLKKLLSSLKDSDLAVLTTIIDQPVGYGRIVRKTDHSIAKIVEEKDADKAQKIITEVNTGIICAHTKNLISWLNNLDNDNAQHEYYLTDCIELAVKDNKKVSAVICNESSEVMGVNSRKQLSEIEKIYQSRQRERLMNAGVTCKDPNTLYIEGNITAGKDITIEPNVLLKGDVCIEDNVTIEMNNIIIDTVIKEGVTIHANSHIENAKIGMNCEIGPYARIRPETVLAKNVKIGNFVEIKKATIDHGSKVNHLSYIGDAEVGSDTNIGAGTISCNYDGANKYKTIIGKNVFIGSDTQLIAPVTINDGATIGAGSTITKDVPADKLTLSRNKQITINHWQRPTKK
jgi:bifunctional UDP-N-acetylglucosamine pyrophosphorylase/glucosamine-1-phosphate N-acetyltransferase